MPFSRHVEIGRVCLVNYGADYGKLVTIVDVLDSNRVLVDAPGMVRGIASMRRLALTDIKLSIQRIPKKTALTKALAEAKVTETFNASAWGQKIQTQAAKASLGDFDRFKLMVARVKKSSILKREMAKLKSKK